MPIYYFLHILTILEAFEATCGLQYYISDEKTFSRDAKHSCTLASPPIKFNLNILSVGINNRTIHNSHGVLVDGQRFWIGYVKAYTALLYKGCASKVNSTVVYRNMKEDTGLCSSRCQTDFIGLQASTCHCIKSLPTANQLLANGCSKLCTYQPGVLCGNSNYISVYQKDIYPSIANDQSGNCLSYNQRLSWTQCFPSTKPNRMCQKDDSAAPITFASETWSQAMQLCIKNATYPVSASNIYLPQTKGGSLWTGQIRSRGILHSIDNTTHYEQGYVIFVNGQFELKFGLTIDLYSICVNRTTALPTASLRSSPTTVPWSLHSPNSSHITAHNELSTSSTRPTNTQSSTQHTVRFNNDTTFENSENTNNKDISNADASRKVVIYTVVPTSLVVIIGVTVFLIWKRRHHNATTTNTTTSANITTTLENEDSRYQDLVRNNFVMEENNEYASLEHVYENTKHVNG